MSARRTPRPPTAASGARRLAFGVLVRVERDGAWADVALRAALARSPLDDRDRALATELVYGTLRWRGLLDLHLREALDRELSKLEPRVATLLRLGAYQLVCTDRIPARAAVDESVRLARAAGLERAAGLVNAALRRVAEAPGVEPPPLARDPVGHLVHGLSLPPWLAERWLAEYGAEQAAALAWASNRVPPLTLRANRTRTTRDALLQELCERFPGASVCALAPDGLRLPHRGDPARDAAFREGRFTVQDEASQLVVELLDPRPGELVLDVCAAPGTKTSAIAERLGASDRVLAVDRSARRLALLERDARRLGLGNIELVVADATRRLPCPVHRGFDRILVDAPCSGLGTLRRHPEARWRVAPEDPARLARVQGVLLERAASVLRPGGTLVYSTCTLLPEENERVVQALLDAHRELRLLTGDDLPRCLRGLANVEGWVRTLPHRHDIDGFFMARLERSA